MSPSLRNIFRRSTRKDTAAATPPAASATAAAAAAAAKTSTSAEQAQNKEPEVTAELIKRADELEEYVGAKHAGSLGVYLSGPQSFSARVTASVWTEEDDNFAAFEDRNKGFVKTSHASFESYRRKKFIKTQGLDRHGSDSDEFSVLFDVESDHKYENVNPGTVTVEGFGLECWDYEEKFGAPRMQTTLVNRCDMPDIPSCKLLRRLDELSNGPGALGWNPDRDEADLKEFVGNLGIVYFDATSARDPNRWISDLYSLLNRTDIFVDFTTKSSVAITWAGPKDEGVGVWNLLWQIVIAKELSRRMERYPKGTFYTGLTARVLASLTIADLWVQNIRAYTTDAKLNDAYWDQVATDEDKAKAEQFKAQADEAHRKGELDRATELYTEAVKLDLTNAVYRNSRAATLCAQGRYPEATQAAYIAVQLDSKYAEAWARLGMAELKQGNGKRAEDAYKRAIETAGPNATDDMRKGLADAVAKIEADVKAINTEKDKARQIVLHKELLDRDWNIAQKCLEFSSLVHERQTEGLLLFAERIKWPYINEVRNYVEDVYTDLRSGKIVLLHLHDWLHGMSLPGRYFAFKVMSALILCTTSLAEDLGTAFYYECGLSLPQKSYWRARTVLGRVLGSLPGVISLNGWIGPCPTVEFDPPLDAAAQKRPRHIRLKARRFSPHEYKPESTNGVIIIGNEYSRHDATQKRAGEPVESYLAEMEDPKQWIIPDAPAQLTSTCTVKTIRLKTLPLDVNITKQLASKEISEADAERETEYRASIVFETIGHDANLQPASVSYNLFTNPIFVTAPPCQPGPMGAHEVHAREIQRYKNSVWTVVKLKDHIPEDGDPMDVMVINATGKGEEVLARAWCAERGRNALIRRAGGPCYACAVKAASKAGLGLGVLVWV